MRLAKALATLILLQGSGFFTSGALAQEGSGQHGRVDPLQVFKQPSAHPTEFNRLFSEGVDGWEGFEALPPDVQATLRDRVYSPLATPIGSTNIRANDVSADPLTNETQSAVSVAAWNEYVVVIWFDTRGWEGTLQNPTNTLVGYAYSCDFGATFTDGGSVPRNNANEQALKGSVVSDDQGNFFLAANYGTGLDVNGNWTDDTHAVWKGGFSGGCAFTWSAPTLVASTNTAVTGDWFLVPRIAADPSSNNVHVTYTRHFSAGASNQVEVVTSTDGGSTWGTPSVLSDIYRHQDPRITVGPDGEVYVVWASDFFGKIHCDLSSPDDIQGHILFSKSVNGGTSWSPQAVVAIQYSNHLSSGPGNWWTWDPERTSIGVDRSNGPNRGNLYIVWNEATTWPAPTETGNFVAEPVEPTNDTPAGAATIAVGDSAVGVSEPGTSDYWRLSLTAGDNVIMRLEPDDFTCANNSSNSSFFMRLYADPLDLGATPDTLLGYDRNNNWIQQIIFTAHRTGDYYLRVWDSALSIGYTIRTAELDYQPGTLTPARDESDVVGVVSTDGGTTFSSKMLVNHDAPAGYKEEIPFLTVDSEGKVFVFWYDRRETDTVPTAVNTAQLTDIYMASSSDGFASLGPGQRISDESSTNSGFPRTSLSPGPYQGAWADGQHLMVGWADQRGSNRATSHYDVYTNFIDFEPPTTVFEVGPAESAWVATANVDLEWMGTDRKSASVALLYSTELDGGGFGSFVADTTVTLGPLAEGYHTYKVRAQDEAGNTGATAIRTFIVDLRDPWATFTAGPLEGQAVLTSDVTFSWTGNDSLAGTDVEFAYQLDGGGFTAWGTLTTADLLGLALGAHVFDVQVRDPAGRITQITRNFTVDVAVRWNVDSNGNWMTPSNWNTGTVPSPTDSVVIDRPGGAFTIAVSSGAQTAASLSCEENLLITGGSLTLGGDSQISGSLTQSVGTLDVSGSLTLSGSLDWSGGTMSGTGTTLLPPGTNHAFTSANGKTLNGRAFRNEGTVDWSEGNLFLNDGSVFENPGTMVYGSTQFNVEINTTSGTGSFDNSGTLQMTGTRNILIRNTVTFTNPGLVDVDGGEFRILGDATITGDVDVAPGAAIEFLGGIQTLTTDSRLFGGGTVQTGTGGVVTVTGDLDIGTLLVNSGSFTLTHADTIPDITMSGSGSITVTGDLSTTNSLTLSSAGTLDVTGDHTISGSLDWSRGTMSGTGTTLLPPGTNHMFTSTNEKILNGRAFRNEGTVDWSEGNLFLNDGSVFENPGTMVYGSTQFNFVINATSGTGSFDNSGTLQMTGTRNILISNSVTFTNPGLVDVDGGEFRILGDATITGDVDVAPGGTVEFFDGTQSFPLASRLFGGGILKVSSGAVHTVDGDLDIGTLLVNSGSFTLTHADTIPDITMSGSGSITVTGDLSTTNSLTLSSGGTLDVTGDHAVSGSLSWPGGTMTGTGTTYLSAGTNHTLTTGTLSGRTFRNEGTINWTNGSLNLDDGSVVDNLGTMVFGSNQFNYEIRTNGTGTFNNLGTFQKTTTPQLLVSTGITFANPGILDVDEGTFHIGGSFLNLSGDTLSGGTYRVKGTLKVIGADIITNTASILLDGGSSQIVDELDADALANFAVNGTGGSFTLTNGASLLGLPSFENQGTMLLELGGSLGVDPGVYLQTGGTTTVNGAATLLAVGGVDLQGGILGGTGVIGNSILNSAEVSPGVSPGILVSNGPYTQTGTGTLSIEIAGSPVDSTDVLAVNGEATFAGPLDVSLLNGFVPSIGEQFTIATFDSSSGMLSPENLPALPSDRTWEVLYNPTSLDLAVAVNDTTAPSVIFTAGPVEGSTILDSDVTIGWTGLDDHTATPSLEYSYQLDGGGYTAFGADSSIALMGLAVGPHSLDVQARDEQSNIGTATRNFTVDVAVRWSVDADGDWATPSNWNTGAVPTALDSVVIDRAGGPFTITVSTGAQAARAVTSEEILTLSGGSLSMTGDLLVNNDLNLSGARLIGGTVLDGASTNAQFNGGTLDGVTVETDMGPAVAGISISLENGPTLNGTLNLSLGAALYIRGSQTVGGTGEIVFDGNSSNTVLGGTSGDTLTIGPNLTIRGERGNFGNLVSVNVINNGTIRADVANTTGLRFFGLVSSSNLIEATNGGKITIAGGTWSNTGILQATNGGILEAGGTTTTAGLGTFEGITGTVYLTGTIDNTGNTLQFTDLTGTPILAAFQGRILGGTVSATGSASLLYGGGTLDGVTVETDMGPAAGDVSISLENGPTLNGTLNLSLGAALYIRGSQTVGGTGEIVFDGNSSNTVLGGTSGDTLTIGPNLTIRGERGNFGNLVSVNVINNGTIRADVANTTGLRFFGLVSSSNLIEATNGGKITIAGGTWSNTGILQATNGGILEAGGTTTTAGLGTFEGITGTVYLTGTIDNTGNTLQFTDLTGTPILAAFQGRILGGTVSATGSASLLYGGGTLDGVTVETDMGPAAGDVSISLENGPTLNGTLNLSLGAALYIRGSQTVGGTGEIVFDGNSSNTVLGGTSGDTLTIGPNLTIRGERGNFGNLVSVNVINNGTIRADVANTTGIRIFGSSITNTGLFEAINGGTLGCGAPVSSSGTVHVGAGSEFKQISNTFTQTAGTVTLDSTATFSSSALIQLTGGVLEGFGTVTGASGLESTAEVRPGALSPGTLNLFAYDQNPPGSLVIQIGGTDPADYDRLVMQSAALLGGDLNVSLINGFTPAPDDSFTVVEYALGFGSDFETLNLPPLPTGLEWVPIVTSSDYTLAVAAADTLPPNTILVSTPPDSGWITSDSLTVSWTGLDNTTPAESLLFSYELDGAGASPFVPDTTATLNGLGSGPHTFTVTARDLASNIDPTPASVSFMVDTVEPMTTILTGPIEGSTVDTTDITFSWSGTDDQSPVDSLLFSYGVVGFPFFQDSTSQVHYGGQIDVEGPQTFQVYAVDLAGNQDATPATRNFVVDFNPPVISFTGGPAEGDHIDTTGTDVAWTATDVVSPRDSLKFSYQIDGGGFTSFNSDSTTSLAGLGEGAHSVEVQSRDLIGHIGSNTLSFTVDLTPPTIAQTQGPLDGGFADSSVTFGWSGTDNLSTPGELLFSYQFDGGGWTPFASITQTTLGGLSIASHTFDLRSQDMAGNISLTLSITFQVDILDPETAITTAPTEGDTTTTSPVPLAWSGNDDLSPLDSLEYSYRVDTDPFSVYDRSTAASLFMSDGSHTVEVMARDLAGNEDATPAVRTFVLDTEPPNLTFILGPVEDEHLDTTDVTFGWTATDLVSQRSDLQFEYSLDNGLFSGLSDDSTATFLGLPEGLHSIEVRAVDLAGHASIAARTFRIDLTPPTPNNPTAQLQDEAEVLFTFTAFDEGTVVSYHAQVDTDPAFGSPEVDTTLSGSIGTMTLQGLFGSTYYARGTATDQAGNVSTYSGLSNGAVILNQPDLTVPLVSGPPVANSGQSIQISWTVADSGVGGTNVPAWSDRIYLSPTPTLNLGTATVLGTIQNLTYLSPDDSYTNDAIFTLPQGIAGTFYAIVRTDILDQQSESSGSNNDGTSSAINIALSDHADLQVTALTVPSNAFSGDPISVSWTVQNAGTGRTDVDSWYDTVFLSTDSTFDFTLPSAGTIKFLDEPLARVLHTGALDADSTYTTNQSVTLPPLADGDHTIFVWSDIGVSFKNQTVLEGGAVFENVFELNNNGDENGPVSDPITITLTPPADLVVDSFAAPGAVASGTSIDFSWTVRNGGFNPTFESYWTDKIYISSDATFDGGDAIFATVARSAGLDRDSTYTVNHSQALGDPSLFGTHWFFVETAPGQVIEVEDTNNASGPAQIDIALSPWPDLQVLSTIVPDSAQAGETIAVSWRSSNQGAGMLPENTWRDRIYLSSSPVLDGSAIKLKTPTVNASSPTLKTSDVNLGLTLGGTYYLHVEADVDDEVFESVDEGNNLSLAAQIEIVPNGPVDLEIGNLNVPGVMASGETHQVDWTVMNLGSGTTLTSAWTERVYLSPDTTVGAGDILVFKKDHAGALNGGGSYNRQVDVTIPNTLSGAYYVLVQTDPGGTTGDVNLANNLITSAFDPGDPGTPLPPISVDPTPPPDLAVVDVHVVGSPVAGQPLQINWTVQNQGSGPPTPSSWVSSVYLSRDPLLGGDVLLGTGPGAGALPPTSSQEDSLTVVLPNYVSGAYYVVVRSDGQRKVYEAGSEANNDLSVPVVIDQPTAADLAVSMVTGPPNATPGDPVTVNWTISNVGGNAANGLIHQAVYISADPVFVSTEDPVVGIVQTNLVNLAPGGAFLVSAEVNLEEAYLADLFGNLTEELPGVTPGDYHFIVRTNIRDAIPEIDQGNNLDYSSILTTVDVPELFIRVPENTTLVDAQNRYYRVSPAADMDMRVKLTSDETSATNEIYIAYNRTPTLDDFDFTGPAEFTASPDILIPSTQGGDYYVLIRTRALPTGVSSQNVTLEARTLPFSLVDITPNAGGTMGEVTTVLSGAGFRDSTEVFLEFGGSFRIPAARVDLVNSTELRVRWNLATVPQATYDVIAVNGIKEVKLHSGFTVEAPLDLVMITTTTHADVIRDNVTAYFTFQYRNDANWNIPYFEARVVWPAGAELVSISTSSNLLTGADITPATEPSLGNHYIAADSITGSSIKVLDLTAADTAPGEELTVTLGIRDFPGSPFSVRSLSEVMDAGTWVARKQEQIDAFRNEVLLNPTGIPNEILVLAADTDAFEDSAFANSYVPAGLITLEELSTYQAAAISGLLDPLSASSSDAPEETGWRDWRSDRFRFGALEDSVSADSCAIAEPVTECVPDLTPVGCSLPDCAVCFDTPAPMTLAFPTVVTMPVQTPLCDGFMNSDCLDSRVIAACDPNQITGPSGYGDPHWIPRNQPAFYTIDFENLSEIATAPAQVVTVSIPLDPDLELSSFELGSIGFGINTVSVPPNLSSFTDEQYYADIGLRVRIVAGVDIANHLAFWTFTSIDPSTGGIPTNPFVGFLPVNDQLGRGQGFCTLQITPSSGAGTGIDISAQAEITFDNNAPIFTNTVSNTVDSDLPTSALYNTTQIDSTTFELEWSGDDVPGGSGLDNFGLYMREDSGPFYLLQGNLTGNTFQFTGDPGHVYGFHTRASDNSGNMEAAKFTPEQEVGIGGQTGIPDGRNRPAFQLLQNAPNPFNDVTTVRFSLASEGEVDVYLFNVAGRLLKTVIDGRILPPGEHEFQIDGRGLASGVYFYQLRAGGKVITRKMLLVR